MSHQGSAASASEASSQLRLADTLADALERKLTGSLTLGDSLVAGHIVYLCDGLPAKARTAEVVAPLDETLLSMDLLDEATIIDCYELACDSGRLLGAVLVDEGYLDEPTLVRALRKQLAAKVAWMFELPANTPIHFHRDADLLDGYGGPERIGFDPEPLLAAGVCPVWSHPLLVADWLIANETKQPQAASGPITVAEVVATLEAHKGASHEQVLGVARGASHERIVQAYVELTRRWHPDGLSERQDKLRPAVERVYLRIVTAYSALSYMRPHARPSEAREPYGYDVASALSSDAMCQRAKHLQASGDLESAERVLRKAMSFERHQPEVRALFAWIKAARLGAVDVKPGHTSDHYAWPIRILDRVLRDEPDYELARYRRGVLLRRSGYLARAMADFERVLEHNPDHVDAARELRLQKMRSQRSEHSGVFRRMFYTGS